MPNEARTHKEMREMLKKERQRKIKNALKTIKNRDSTEKSKLEAIEALQDHDCFSEFFRLIENKRTEVSVKNLALSSLAKNVGEHGFYGLMNFIYETKKTKKLIRIVEILGKAGLLNPLLHLHGDTDVPGPVRKRVFEALPEAVEVAGRAGRPWEIFGVFMTPDVPESVRAKAIRVLGENGFLFVLAKSEKLIRYHDSDRKEFSKALEKTVNILEKRGDVPHLLKALEIEEVSEEVVNEIWTALPFAIEIAALKGASDAVLEVFGNKAVPEKTQASAAKILGQIKETAKLIRILEEKELPGPVRSAVKEAIVSATESNEENKLRSLSTSHLLAYNKTLRERNPLAKDGEILSGTIQKPKNTPPTKQKPPSKVIVKKE